MFVVNAVGGDTSSHVSETLHHVDDVAALLQCRNDVLLLGERPEIVCVREAELTHDVRLVGAHRVVRLSQFDAHRINHRLQVADTLHAVLVRKTTKLCLVQPCWCFVVT